jgi:hypothetical protein
MAKVSIYNMAVGGFGAVEYWRLLTTKAVQLHPKVVIVGIYLGNDIADAYRTAYNLPAWQNLRNKNPQYNEAQQNNDKLEQTTTPQVANIQRNFVELRNWLAGHSIIYRMSSFTALGSWVQKNEAKNQNNRFIFAMPIANHTTLLSPTQRANALDTSRYRTKEGLRISRILYANMAVFSKKNNIKLHFVLIPCKETVFVNTVNNQHPLYTELLRSIKNEAIIKNILTKDFERQNIPYTDLLVPLQNQSQVQIIYPATDDHPNNNGYKIIAQFLTKTTTEYLSTSK